LNLAQAILLGEEMRIYQLRIYHLRTGSATEAYGKILAKQIENLREYGIETHGLFTSPSKHNAIIALVSYSEAMTPHIAAMLDAICSVCKSDMTGFDAAQIIRGDDLLLQPLSGAPLH
jgi:hypothetical protein